MASKTEPTQSDDLGICPRCGRCHATDALVDEHIGELFEDQPTVQSDNFDRIFASIIPLEYGKQTIIGGQGDLWYARVGLFHRIQLARGAIQAQVAAAYQRGRIDEAKTCEEAKRHG